MHKGRIALGVIAVVVTGLVAASVAGASSQGSTKAPPAITVGFLQILGASPAAMAMQQQDRVVGRRAPAQRLVAVRDVDDRQSVETEHHILVGPRAGLVGPAMAHQV